ncbi:MAG: sulfite oxidase [Actinobacteria bacterium]|nr:MAG: sulfite oxidase [Actinomycetota bacterium]
MMQPAEPEASDQITIEELQLAARNHGMPLEALRYEITPVGLHYLLIHYDIPAIDPGSWNLTVSGRVRKPLTLSLDDILSRPAVTLPVTMECAGNGRARLSPRPLSQPWLSEAIGTGEWTGISLVGLLSEAEPDVSAAEVVFTGADHGVEGGVEQDYARSLPLDEAMKDTVILAYKLNGQLLPPQHGFPLRLVVPGWYGMTSVKWLRSIEVVSEPFRGYQQVRGYRYRQDPDEVGEPVTRIAPRALMLPPGSPEFMTRDRVVPRGPCRLEGRAWSGWGPIERVEVTADGGRSWAPARLGSPPGPTAWTPWSFDWTAEPGSYVLMCRARDATGREQPMMPEWNVGGYANNSVQRVRVTVAASPA